jgi:uncharacterized membrane protein
MLDLPNRKSIMKFNKEDRPAYTGERTPFDWLLEGITVIGVAFIVGFTIYYYGKLPQTIPTHFNGSGKVDDFGSKSMLWFLPGLVLFTYTLLTLVSRIPEKFNYLVKITPENAQAQYRMALHLIGSLKGIIAWLFFFIQYAIIRASLDTAAGLGAYFVPVVLVGTSLPIFLFIIFSLKKK